LLRLDLEKGMLVCFSGFLSSNVYLIVMDGKAVAVDGGMPWTANRVLDYLSQSSSELEYILLTHSHFDHVMGLDKLKKKTKAKVLAHPKNKRGDVQLEDGNTIRVLSNKLSFVAIYTGVHRMDHVWFFEENNGLLFVGDHIATSPALKALAENQDSSPKIILPGHGKPYRLGAHRPI
jgi:glyoxylase-like metal-dependent hydrolase (beta-lactamase superfamily II)